MRASARAISRRCSNRSSSTRSAAASFRPRRRAGPCPKARARVVEGALGVARCAHDVEPPLAYRRHREAVFRASGAGTAPLRLQPLAFTSPPVKNWVSGGTAAGPFPAHSVRSGVEMIVRKLLVAAALSAAPSLIFAAPASAQPATPAAPAAAQAAVQAGAVVKDPQGGEVGTIASVEGDQVVLRTDRHQARIPAAAIR